MSKQLADHLLSFSRTEEHFQVSKSISNLLFEDSHYTADLSSDLGIMTY